MAARAVRRSRLRTESALTLLTPIAADPADPLRSAAQVATEMIR